MDESFSSLGAFSPHAAMSPSSPVNDASAYYQAHERANRTVSSSSTSSIAGADAPPAFANTHLAVSPLSDVAFVACTFPLDRRLIVV